MFDQTKYYTEYSPMTYLPDEPEITMLLEDLPDTITGIIEYVQNTVIHIYWRGLKGLEIAPERQGEINIRSAANILRKAYETKQSPLSVKRDYAEKVIGNCRDFTVLCTSLLRRKGIPARARCGFGTYFSNPTDKLQYVDHWVAEYWNGEKWIMVDAQIDPKQKKYWKIDIDILNVPDNKFITGGAAWTMCRNGADPDLFGINDMHGWWFIKGDMIRDLASLAKTPLLAWDIWGAMTDDKLITDPILDQAAKAAVPGTQDYDTIFKLNEHPWFKVPETFFSFIDGERKEFKLSDVTEKM